MASLEVTALSRADSSCTPISLTGPFIPNRSVTGFCRKTALRVCNAVYMRLLPLKLRGAANFSAI